MLAALAGIHPRQLDVLSEITGVGEYAEVARHTIQVDLEGAPCRVLDLYTPITAKKAMNSPKDHQAVVELEAIRERLRGLKKSNNLEGSKTLRLGVFESLSL